MPDTSFLASFANNPLTLTILIAGVIIIVFMWKVAPMLKLFNNGYDKLRESMDKVSIRMMRLELLDLINHKPQAKDAIFSKYDEYKAAGGNSYIDNIVDNWKKAT